MSDHRDIGGHTVNAHLVQRSRYGQPEFVTHPESPFGRPVSSHVWWRYRLQTDVCQLREPRFLGLFLIEAIL